MNMIVDSVSGTRNPVHHVNPVQSLNLSASQPVERNHERQTQ